MLSIISARSHSILIDFKRKVLFNFNLVKRQAMYPALEILLALAIGSGLGMTLAMPVAQVPVLGSTLIGGVSDLVFGSGSQFLENGSNLLGDINSLLGGQTTF